MKKTFLCVLAVVLFSTVVLAESDQSSVCFDYQGNGTYFLQNSGLGYHSEVVVTDLGTQIEIVTTLDSIAKPYISWGERDRDGNSVVEADELRSDGEWIYINDDLMYEWVVYGGNRDSEIVLTGYPSNLEYKPIIYTATISEPNYGDSICLDVHHSPNGEYQPTHPPAVPEFSTIGIMATIVIAGIGLYFIAKRRKF